MKYLVEGHILKYTHNLSLAFLILSLHLLMSEI